MRKALLTAGVPAVAALMIFAIVGCDHNHYDRDDAGWYQHHSDWDGHHVEFDGTVQRVHDRDVGSPGWDAYQVGDGTNTVWVRSQHGSPAVGDHLTVRGTARTDERFGADDLGPTVDEDSRHKM